jgi:hypothetical protein
MWGRSEVFAPEMSLQKIVITLKKGIHVFEKNRFHA